MEEKKYNFDNINRELCRRIATGDTYAETELITTNIAFIVSVSKRFISTNKCEQYRAMGFEREDFLQAGRKAMIRAAYTFDESVQESFASYAYPVIENAMIDLIRKGQSTYEWKGTEDKNTRVFLDEIIETDCVMDPQQISVSFENDPAGNLAVKKIMIEKMLNRFEKLSEREKKYLIIRFGLIDGEEKNVTETARYFFIRRSKAKRLENKALSNLKEGLLDGKII